MSERHGWRLNGLRRRLPGREVRLDDDLELHVDGTHIPVAWPLDQRWVKTRISDATDAEMLGGLARYVSACLTQDPICVDQGCYLFAPETPERTACEQACRIRKDPVTPPGNRHSMSLSLICFKCGLKANDLPPGGGVCYGTKPDPYADGPAKGCLP